MNGEGRGVSGKPRIRVVVLYGGRSGEHEISLQSAASIVRHLDSDAYEVLPVSIDKRGCWRLQPAPRSSGQPAVALTIDDEAPQVSLRPGRPELVDERGGRHAVDVVFPVLHGPLCEDGSVQGLLELSDVAYVGAGVLASAVAMDKEVAKRLVAAEGIATSPDVPLRWWQWQRDSDASLARIQSRLQLPVFVKPANLGSSVGISQAGDAAALRAAIDNAFVYDDKVLVEQALSVREVELSVLESLDGCGPLVSQPGEIIPRHGFYSYEAKYLDAQGAQLVVPADLDPVRVEQARELAARIFQVLECEGMARVDLFLEKSSGRFFFNEINTIPGFTRISMYPRLWEASGLPYAKLLRQLVELARSRHARKSALRRDWQV